MPVVPEYIVECSVCRKPFKVESPLPPVAPAATIPTPEHEMLRASDGKPGGVSCLGVGTPAIGMGRKEDYRDKWGRAFG